MIRNYKNTDLDELMEAWYTSSKIAHDFLDEDFFIDERKNIETIYLPVAETWVYELEGKVVGFISLIENEVGGLFVHSDYQGKGIGRKLMDYATSIRNELVLNVFEDNSIGRRFYKKYGFKIIGVVKHEKTAKNQIRMIFKME